eukprot:scaffold10803_cov133-Isochrysis_galbana.AAC.3
MVPEGGWAVKCKPRAVRVCRGGGASASPPQHGGRRVGIRRVTASMRCCLSMPCLRLRPSAADGGVELQVCQDRALDRQDSAVVREHEVPLLHLVETLQPLHPRALPRGEGAVVQCEEIVRVCPVPPSHLAPRHLGSQVGAVDQSEQRAASPAQVVEHHASEGVARPNLLVRYDGHVGAAGGEPREESRRVGRRQIDQHALGQHERRLRGVPTGVLEGAAALLKVTDVGDGQVVSSRRRGDPARPGASRSFGKCSQQAWAGPNNGRLACDYIGLIELYKAPGLRAARVQRPEASVESGAEGDNLRTRRCGGLEELSQDRLQRHHPDEVPSVDQRPRSWARARHKVLRKSICVVAGAHGGQLTARSDVSCTGYALQRGRGPEDGWR